MDIKELCPICGEGHVTSHVEMVESEYKGQTKLLPSHYRLCDACHSDFAGAPEGKLNKRGIMAFRKSVDGLLTGAEICALRDRYKLTQIQAARLFGGGPVAFSKYENDDVSQSESMDSLLRLVRRSEAAFWELVDEKDMSAELVPAKVAKKVVEPVVTIFNRTTNVFSIADFLSANIKFAAKTTYVQSVERSRQKNVSNQFAA
jgi:HTH-type transcriptional regulator / antitoxin MqsA